MNHDPHKAWIDFAENETRELFTRLVGNRAGLHELREALDQALEGPHGTIVMVGTGSLEIESVSMLTEPPVPKALSKDSKLKNLLSLIGFLSLVITFLVLAGIGLVHVVQIFLT